MEYQPIKYLYKKYTKKQIYNRSLNFYKNIKNRRSIREFKSLKISDRVIKNAILAAGSAPSGANLQPWHFVIIKNKLIKKKIRIAAEKEEYKFYKYKATKDWLNALKPIGTNSQKEFLEKAPILIAIFEKKFSMSNNIKTKNYYVKESVGIATGILISCLHYSGLSMLTHTPNPMNFLNKILKRPKNEKPFLLLVIGYSKKNCVVPYFATKKKSLTKISKWI